MRFCLSQVRFCLSQEEYEALAPAAELERAKKALEWIRGRFPGARCIHSSDEVLRERQEQIDRDLGEHTVQLKRYEYCDSCLLGSLDPERGPPKELREILCPLKKNYHK